MKCGTGRLALCVAITMAIWDRGAAAADGPYKLIKDVAIGGEGGWDYLSVDPAGKRLYISHGTKVVVYDTAKDEIAGEISDTPGVHGAVVGSDGHVFTSNGRENKASIVDAKTLQLVKKVATQGNPDFIMYEPAQNRSTR